MLDAFEEPKSGVTLEGSEGFDGPSRGLDDTPAYADFLDRFDRTKAPADAEDAAPHGVNPGFEGLEEPETRAEELLAFLTGLFQRDNLPWLAVRVIPVVMVLIAGVLLWPSQDGDAPVEVSIRATDALVPQVELAEVAPGLRYSAPNPQLFVDLDGDGIADATGLPIDGASADAQSEDGDPADDATADDDPVTTEAEPDPNEDADDPSSGNGSIGPTTTASAATTAAPTTAAETTQAPTTAAATTQPPTTQAPTTQPPTTQAPTTQPPTTPPPTQPPTTQPPSNNCSSGGEFERVFRDDFNGSSVGSAWTQYNSAGNAGYGLRRPSAITVQDGKLVITAQMENGTLVSGGMNHNVNQTYGKVVFRVRTDNDPSQAVSGVVLTWPTSGVHPRDGENNIYETLVQTPNRNPFFTFIHKPFGTTSDQEYKQHFADGAQWQTMTMEWTPDRITIIREGPGNNSNYDAWTVNETGADLIPDVNHRLAIQLDGWKHSIGGPVRMEVDFVEVYRYCG
ncbi:MAG: glycoside hydrolase family 16 protein [Actinomycetota bacterium]